ncbi:hypothetical protein L9F63_003752, partial [Diploptera punctata]
DQLLFSSSEHSATEETGFEGNPSIQPHTLSTVGRSHVDSLMYATATHKYCIEQYMAKK